MAASTVPLNSGGQLEPEASKKFLVETRGIFPNFIPSFQKNRTNIQLIFQFCNYFFSLQTDFSVIRYKKQQGLHLYCTGEQKDGILFPTRKKLRFAVFFA